MNLQAPNMDEPEQKKWNMDRTDATDLAEYIVLERKFSIFEQSLLRLRQLADLRNDS